MKSDSQAKLVKHIREALAQPLSQLTLKACLADVRKLLEMTGTSKRYRTLKFYCDWVLHTKMDKGFVNDLLREVDQAWDNWFVRQIPMPTDFETKIGYKIGLYGFERELAECLEEHSINLPWYGYRDRWAAFEKTYCDVVEDSWLEYSDRKHQLHQINGAQIKTYKVSEHSEGKQGLQPGDYLAYGIVWTFTKDGEPVCGFTITAPSKHLINRED